MNIEDVREYALSMPGATEDQAYGADWVLFRIEGKIFLHIWLDSPEPTCALKLPQEQAQQLRDHYDGIRPAYHLNKVHWKGFANEGRAKLELCRVQLSLMQ